MYSAPLLSGTASMQVGGAARKAAAILLTHVVRTGLATIRALFSAENGSEIPYNV